MKNKLINAVGYTGLVVILAMISAAAFRVFKNGFNNISNTTDFISAFAGAFFAFVFVKLGELGTRLYMRQRVNQEALVVLEQTLQEYVNRLYGNDFVIDDIVKTIRATTEKPEDAIKVNFNFLKPLPIDTSPLIHLRNIDYKNDLFNFYADVEKTNGSMESLQRFYDRMTDNFITGTIDRTTYIQNLGVIESKMSELKRFLATAIEDCVDIAAKTRILLKETPVLFVSAIRLKPQRYDSTLNKRLAAEKETLRTEMRENTAESLARIKKTVGSK